MEEIVEVFWMRVDKGLKENHISLRELSDLTGIKYDTMRAWRYHQQLPNTSSIVLIATALHTSIDFLLGHRPEGLAEYVNAIYYYPSLKRIVSKCVDHPEVINVIEKMLVVFENERSTYVEEEETAPLRRKKSTG